MRQMLEGRFFDARFCVPEVMTLAFVNQVHCIRLAYLSKSETLSHVTTKHRTQASELQNKSGPIVNSRQNNAA